jgi:hypothetical protein
VGAILSRNLLALTILVWAAISSAHTSAGAKQAKITYLEHSNSANFLSGKTKALYGVDLNGFKSANDKPVLIDALHHSPRPKSVNRRQDDYGADNHNRLLLHDKPSSPAEFSELFGKPTHIESRSQKVGQNNGGRGYSFRAHRLSGIDDSVVHTILPKVSHGQGTSVIVRWAQAKPISSYGLPKNP